MSLAAGVAGGTSPTDVHPFTRQVQRIAERIGCTEGQVYSMAIALTAVTVLSLFAAGVPLGSKPVATANTLLGQAPVTEVTQSNTPPSTGLGGALPGSGLPKGGGLAAVGGGSVSIPGSTSLPVPSSGSTTTIIKPPPPHSLTSYAVSAPGFPAALAVDGTHVYAGTDNATNVASVVEVFYRTHAGSHAITIAGQPATRTGGLSAAAVRGNTLLVTDRSRGDLLAIDPVTRHVRILATLPNLPACGLFGGTKCQPGLQDTAPSAEGLAVSGDKAYIADAGQDIIWRYSFATRKLALWYSSTDFTAGNGPSGLAIDPAGSLVFSVSQTLDTGALLQAAVYRLGIDGSGAPGGRDRIASFSPNTAPGAIAVGSSGRVYVAMRSGGGIETVSPAGTVAPLAGAGASRFPSPAGLFLVGGLLYVADSGKPANATSGTIRTVSVSDTPATTSTIPGLPVP